MAYRDELEAAQAQIETSQERLTEREKQIEKKMAKLRAKRAENAIMVWVPFLVALVAVISVIALLFVVIGALIDSCDAYAVRKAQGTSPENPTITEIVPGSQHAGRLTDTQARREHFYELRLTREALVIFNLTVEGRCQEGAGLEGYIRGERRPFLETSQMYGRDRSTYGAEGVVSMRLPPGAYRFAPVGDPECPMSFVFYTLPVHPEERKERGEHDIP